MIRVQTSRRSVATIALDARLREQEATTCHGDCSDPVPMHLIGAPDPVLYKLGLDPDRKLSQELYARCRRCPECLAHRRRLWTARAIAECSRSTRTWFGTLTLAPDRALQAAYAADLRIARRASDPTDENKFRESVRYVAPEITKFLKRIRKLAKFRYLLVTEAHQSGVPHWHLLIHEQGPPISKRDLETKWRYGFSHWRLVDTLDPRAAGYVCKYLNKTAATRVRGSQLYGGAVTADLTERLKEVTRALCEIAEKRAREPGPVPGTQPDAQ